MGWNCAHEDKLPFIGRGCTLQTAEPCPLRHSLVRVQVPNFADMLQHHSNPHLNAPALGIRSTSA